MVRTGAGEEHYLLEDPGQLTGIFPDVIRALAAAINFTATFYQRLDGDYGVERNGTYSGIIGSLIRGDMDMIGAALTLSTGRYEDIDYLMPIGKARNAVFIKDDLARNFRLTLFLEPFSLDIWSCLCVVAVVNLVFIVALRRYYYGRGGGGGAERVDKFHRKLRRYRRRPPRSGPPLRESEAAASATVLWTTAAANFGWCSHSPSACQPCCCNSLRFLLFSVAFVGNVMFMSYQSSLTSSLSIVKLKLPFEDLDGLIVSGYKSGNADAYM